MPSLPETRFLACERSGAWVTVWIDRPEVKNALSLEAFEELRDVFSAIRDDEGVRGVTLRGRGGTFSAGGDLKMFRDLFQGDLGAEEIARSSRFFAEVYRLIDAMPQFVLMLVEGAAIAGGLGLVCVADFAVVTKDARFAMTETTLGIPPAQIAPLVVRAIGRKAARRLMLTASRFGGEEAARLGLADLAVEDGAALAAAEAAIRARVMQCAPGANAATKRLLLEVGAVDDAAFVERAARAYADCMLSAEGREGVAAFFGKRPPAWAAEQGG